MKLGRSEEIKKRVVLYEERCVPKLVCSPEVWEHPRAHALGCPRIPPSGEMHSYGNLPYNRHFSSQSFGLLIKPLPEQLE